MNIQIPKEYEEEIIKDIMNRKEIDSKKFIQSNINNIKVCAENRFKQDIKNGLIFLLKEK